ncbi:hypothetical protein BCR34DRAFT_606191 [Clohesyomyces aquaticus]|uniref:Uncharacterized protein n=1 Tax=Clohesyomyces aquaticus TaxID=1231657 RepID=A0A1Y1YRK9_9PLEO|nr:hypothetical protein BCR34DRAFT_606191 [Clohesyomyces aquaticus]
MSAASSAEETVSNFQQRRDSAIPKESSSGLVLRDFGNGDDQGSQPTSRSSLSRLSRHWTSLQEHADSIDRLGASRGGADTPRPDERRETFMWEAPPVDVQPDFHHNRSGSYESYNRGSQIPLSNIPSTPQPSKDMTMAGFDFTAQPRPIKRLTTDSWGSSDSNPRRNFARFSISTFARGVFRAAPDKQMLSEIEKKYEHRNDTKASDPPTATIRKINQPGRRMSFKPRRPSWKRGESSEEKKQKKAADDSHKSGLKDRRNLNNAESMKLTLPLGLDTLPARQRSPITQQFPVASSQISAPRQRSPKTPWVQDVTPAWPAMVITPPPTIAESPGDALTNKQGHRRLAGSDPIGSSSPNTPKSRSRPVFPSRPRIQIRSSSSRSESPAMTPQTISTPEQYQAETIQALRQGDKQEKQGKRLKRWRWSFGPDASSDVESLDSTTNKIADPGPSSSSSKLLVRPWKKQPLTPPPTASQSRPPNHHTISWLGKNSSTRAPTTNLVSHPTDFIPPGSNRVPTPPLFDERGEIKGKLANFFFDVQGVQIKPPRPSPNTPAGVWDSDAILMPQESNITPKSGSEEESPQGESSVGALSPRPFPTPSGSTPGKGPGSGTGKSPVECITFNPNAHVVPGHGSPVTTPAVSAGLGSGAGVGVVEQDWFRVQLHEDIKIPDSKEEELAKLKWMIPEHLPGSPLCPLSPKYRGNVKICVYHGRRSERVQGSDGVEEWEDRWRDEDDGEEEVWEGEVWDRLVMGPMEGRRGRARLSSFGDPSRHH